MTNKAVFFSLDVINSMAFANLHKWKKKSTSRADFLLKNVFKNTFFTVKNHFCLKEKWIAIQNHDIAISLGTPHFGFFRKCKKHKELKTKPKLHVKYIILSAFLILNPPVTKTQYCTFITWIIHLHARFPRTALNNLSR